MKKSLLKIFLTVVAVAACLLSFSGCAFIKQPITPELMAKVEGNWEGNIFYGSKWEENTGIKARASFHNQFLIFYGEGYTRERGMKEMQRITFMSECAQQGGNIVCPFGTANEDLVIMFLKQDSCVIKRAKDDYSVWKMERVKR